MGFTLLHAKLIIEKEKLMKQQIKHDICLIRALAIIMILLL